MITFSKLGKYGRLGNQLFQISAVIAHSKKNGFDFCFPQWEYNRFLKSPIKTFDSISINNVYNERDPWGYNEIPNTDNMDLVGYFQNSIYFDNIKNEIINILEPNENVKNCVRNNISKYKGSRITALHVRRGDYLKYPNHHPVPPIEYYNKSMEYLKDCTDIFMVFSDDIEWCKNNLNGNLIFSEEKNEFIDLYTMASCNNFIISNSSFSWWGSYLNNNNPKVVAPNQWVGTEYRNKRWKEIYRKEMIIL